jgi:hypothetical protein
MKARGDINLRAGLAGLAIAVLWTVEATAASPAYCALYAREYTAQFATGSDSDTAVASEYRILDQAYYQCLNMDVEPEFPDTSVYYGAALDDILEGLMTPVEGIAEGDAVADDVIVEAEPEAKPKPVRTASRGSGRGSGLEAWSPEWAAWCKKHFPNSFNPEDGTVKPYNEDRRFCH